MKPFQSAKIERRAFLATSLVGGAALLPVPARAATCAARFDQAAYDRYVGLMNAKDPRFVEYYADDIEFIMNIRGKAGVLDFYQRQWRFITETLEVSFFCSDATGAAARVRSELRCIKDYNETTPFGRALAVGEVQTGLGCLFYTLNDRGLISRIDGPPPQILQAWRAQAN